MELVGEVRSTNLTTWQQAVTAHPGNQHRPADGRGFRCRREDRQVPGRRREETRDRGGQALAQTASIDDLFRTIDSPQGPRCAPNSWNLDKLVKARKENIRGEIVQEGVKAFAAHIAGLNAQIGKPYMPPVPADFGGRHQREEDGRKLRDGVATELARAKIAANDIAGRITINLATLRGGVRSRAPVPGHGAVVLKQPDDLSSLITARIAEHAAKLEAERARSPSRNARNWRRKPT